MASPDEERIALFLDYENLAIGAREALGGLAFDFKPIADALAERGRVVSRKAYADWSYFDEDRRMLTRNHVELIEIPQRMGAVRKNAADIKMAVDAIEVAFERSYLTTFVICTGDSDFTPLVYKLRELNKRVIGVGIRASTSKLLPPACDEFLFYENLEGVELRDTPADTSKPEPAPKEEERSGDQDEIQRLIATTVSGLSRSSGDAVLASSLKRALIRKDPTFTEADHGFRAFGELLRHLESKQVITLSEGPAAGDPVVSLASNPDEAQAFELLVKVVKSIEEKNGSPQLSGLKNQVRKQSPGFSEKQFGYGGFLQFCKAAQARGFVELTWDDDANDYLIHATL
ncbi:MAG: PIN domain-containing protein [Acidimicrobiia bacterium]